VLKSGFVSHLLCRGILRRAWESIYSAECLYRNDLTSPPSWTCFSFLHLNHVFFRNRYPWFWWFGEVFDVGHLKQHIG
jgi:hypothetical protein